MADAAQWDAWRALVDKALAGAPFDTLRTSLDDGRGGAIMFDPLSPPAAPVFAGRPLPGPWSAVQRIDDDAGAAAQAREDLEDGATALALVFAGAPSAYGRGLTAATADDIDAALEGVRLDLVPVHLEAGSCGREAFAAFAALIRRRGELPTTLHAGLDPLGAYAAGAPLRHWDGRTGELADAVRFFIGLDLDGTALTADGRILAEAGASPVEELAFAFGALIEYLTALDREGLAPATTLPRIAVALTASQEQFVTIAKLRAARRLHRLVADACGVDAPLTLHATTARRMLAVSDPHTNLLRLTIAAFAAAVGGADAVAVLPFDEAASPFGRRMARNIQNLLLEEAHVARLEDPGAGSGTIEAMTDAIAGAAWALVQSRLGVPLVERIADGSLGAGIAPGEPPVIIGVTKHPPASPVAPLGRAPVEMPFTRRGVVPGPTFADLVTAAEAGAAFGDLAAVGRPSGAPLQQPVVATRASAPYEAA